MVKQVVGASIKGRLILVVFIIVALLIGFFGGRYYSTGQNGVRAVSSGTTPMTVCNCPAILNNQATTPGPAPCHCPEAE